MTRSTYDRSVITNYSPTSTTTCACLLIGKGFPNDCGLNGSILIITIFDM